MTTAKPKVCPRCATMYPAKDSHWRCGCVWCGNILVWATPEAVHGATNHARIEGWCELNNGRWGRTRNRIAL